MRALFLILCLLCSCSKPTNQKRDVSYPLKSQRFVIVIASYNNELFYEKNIRSVFEQKYPNFRVIYIDDASKDNTYGAVKSFVEERGWKDKIQILRNDTNRGAMENFYRAIHSCEDDEVIVVLDGDDWFAHEFVLDELNKVYSDPDVWLTYGSYLSYPSYKKGECSRRVPENVIKKNQIRKYCAAHDLPFSHLKTFYAWLFKEIKLQDLLVNGRFYPSSWDSGVMIPMVEMAHSHVKYVKDILYIYNRTNVLNDDKVKRGDQLFCWQYQCQLPSYQPLSKRPSYINESPDVVVLSLDRPLQLYAFLESLDKYVTHSGRVKVIYDASSPEFVEAYRDIATTFSSCRFFAPSKTGGDWKRLFLDTIAQCPSSYILVTTDDLIFNEKIDLLDCTRSLSETGAYAFYFNTHPGKAIQWDKNIWAWQFSSTLEGQNKNSSNAFGRLLTAIYKKQTLSSVLEKIRFEHMNSLEIEWLNFLNHFGAAEKRDENLRMVGLFFDEERMLSLASKQKNGFSLYSPKELMEKYRAGLKIDIASFQKIDNEIKFVPRERITHVKDGQ